MTMFLLTLAVFATAMSIMAVGVIFKRPCLRGSCGGSEILMPNGEPLTCATCPNRERRERERAAEHPYPGPMVVLPAGKVRGDSTLG